MIEVIEVAKTEEWSNISKFAPGVLLERKGCKGFYMLPAGRHHLIWFSPEGYIGVHDLSTYTYEFREAPKGSEVHIKNK